jgi:aromatic ring hydroxylase
MQQVMLEMQKLQAQITELNTQAELNQAKAYAAVTNPSIEYKGTVAKQQTALQNKSAELDAKTAIARMQTLARSAEGGRIREAEPYRPNQIQSMTAGAEGI